VFKNFVQIDRKGITNSKLRAAIQVLGAKLIDSVFVSSCILKFRVLRKEPQFISEEEG
jgi:hypothetical protein